MRFEIWLNELCSHRTVHAVHVHAGPSTRSLAAAATDVVQSSLDFSIQRLYVPGLHVHVLRDCVCDSTCALECAV